MKDKVLPLLPCILFALCSANAFAAPVAYSGKVAINGLNLDGTIKFKFNIVDANGKVLWRHKINSGGHTDSIDVPVDRGHYLVLLGGYLPEGIKVRKSFDDEREKRRERVRAVEEAVEAEGVKG